MLCELPGRGGAAGPFDGTLLYPLVRGGTSDMTDPVFEATLRRRLDCV
jgi:hypothetical protein